MAERSKLAKQNPCTIISCTAANPPKMTTARLCLWNPSGVALFIMLPALLLVKERLGYETTPGWPLHPDKGRLQTPFLRVSFCCMEGERAIEAKIIANLLTLLTDTGRFKKVLKGEAIKGKAIGEILGWNGFGSPWALTVPDLILAGDNFSKRPDDAFLLAVETKYFPRDASSDKKRWRQSFREIGQPLRDLLYGFDAVVLWHLFSEAIVDEEVGKYSAMCGEVIEKLKLPVVYFATKLTPQNRFAFFYPWRLENTSPLPDAVYVAGCLQQINKERDGSYRTKMNPLLMDEKVLGMRKAVKSALRIP